MEIKDLKVKEEFQDLMDFEDQMEIKDLKVKEAHKVSGD